MAVYGKDGEVIYSSQPLKRIEAVPLHGDYSLYRAVLPGRTVVMAASITPLKDTEPGRFLALGTWLDQNYMSQLSSITSLELRLYYRDGDHFTEFFSSRDGAAPATILGQGVQNILGREARDYYDPHAEHGAYRALYKPLLDPEGKMIGVLFCGLRSADALAGIMSQQNLFLTIFLVGGLLTVLASATLARHLALPLRRLAAAVSAVAAGDFRQQVPVHGNDEVAELAEAFNHMASRLSQLHDLEAQVRRQERLSALGEMAAGIAHEIRNPLSIIKTSSQVVRKRQGIGVQDAQLLEYVAEQVSRIDGLISGFLGFAKPQPPDLAPHLPMEIVGRVTGFCAPELERHAVRLHLEDGASRTTILCDESQVFQACLNLIINAWEAMEGGGDLTISTAQRGNTLRLCFRDSGPGIAPELQEKIFNPFFTTKVQGSGLGLAKVHAVMQAHHGCVEYHGPAGGGAALTLVFPCTTDAGNA